MKTQSEDLSELAPALALAQAELPDVVATESADTGKYVYRYCDLATVRETVLPVLVRHGLSVVQTVVPRREALFAERFCVLGSVRTLLLHSSGQWIAGEQPIAGDWGDPQRIGSAITYARRYGLAAICGVAQVDDDGAAAAPARAASRSTQRASRPSRPDGPPVEDSEPPDPGPEPGTAAYYRSHPQENAGAREFAREQNAARFAAAPPNGAPPGANSSQIVLPSDPPHTGRYLYGWVKEHQQFPFFRYLLDRYPTQLPSQMKDWTNTQVKWAWDQYAAWVGSGQPLPTLADAASNGRR